MVGNYNGQAYIWSKFEGMRHLGLLKGGTFSEAAGINDLGVATGTADGVGIITYPNSDNILTCNALTQPFVWASSTRMRGLRVLGVHSEGTDDCALITYSTGINDRGQVVGYNQDYWTYQWGYLWADRTVGYYGSSWVPTSINGINNTGRMVGEDGVPGNLFFGHATAWSQDGARTDLATLNAATDVFTYASSAVAVNDLGQAVGWSTTTPVPFLVEAFSGCDFEQGSGCPIHAVFWAAGGAIRDLGTLPGDTNSVAVKVNFFGQVIGASGNTVVSHVFGQLSTELTGRPFIWTERTGMKDLNTLIPQNYGWVLNKATDINVWGQIVGEGTRNGQPHGYLLTPLNPFRVF